MESCGVSLETTKMARPRASGTLPEFRGGSPYRGPSDCQTGLRAPAIQASGGTHTGSSCQMVRARAACGS